MNDETKKNDPWYAEFAKRQSQAFALADVMMSQAYAPGELTKDQQACIQIGYATAYENAHEEKTQLQELNFELREDLEWALRTAKSRKFTRDYSPEDHRIHELLTKYKLESLR